MAASNILRRTLDRASLPAGFVRWRLTLGPGEERPSGAVEWVGALVLIEQGSLEVRCLAGGSERFEAGDLLSLGWLPIERLRNPGSVTMSLIAVRRTGPGPGRPERGAGGGPGASPLGSAR